jgi:hypothetical protein
MTVRHVIFTGGNAGYWRLLRGLLLSLRQNLKRTDVDVMVFDLGLTPEQRAEAEALSTAVLDAEWDLPFPCLRGAPEYYKAFTVKPNLPRYASGYDVYIWIDADAWVQSGEVIDLLIAGARTGRMAVVPELDRAYPTAVARGKVRQFSSKLPILGDRLRRVGSWLRNGLIRRYDRKIGNAVLFAPTINAGVFACRGDSPYWNAWVESYRRARIRGLRDISDQFPLNHAIYTGRIAIHPLPAWCNWICDLALPQCDDEGALVEPLLPHRRLGIVHILGRTKDRLPTVTSLAGEPVERNLEFVAEPDRKKAS